ncbi:Protein SPOROCYTELESS [Hirschfeldia incana]|nr:Protein SPOROCYTELESS [Hirschfeldia incana]
MATSLSFMSIDENSSLSFMSTNQNSLRNPNELLRNTNQLANGEIRTEPPPKKSRGRKPGSKSAQQNQKKPTLRGMGVAKLERFIAEEEKKKLVVPAGEGGGGGGGDTSAASANSVTRFPDRGVVLQGFPSYGGGPTNTSLGGYSRSRFLCGGAGSGQIVIDPVCSPWGFVETSTSELSSIPNPQMYNASNNHCDTCFKKKRLDGDQNVVRSNGGGFSKYTMMIPPPMMNGYDDQRSQGFFYDQRIARSAPASASMNPYFNEATNLTGSMEEFSSVNPRNGTRGVKEYEFFPGKYDDFQGKSFLVATSVGDCSPTTSSPIDLSLKL